VVEFKAEDGIFVVGVRVGVDVATCNAVSLLVVRYAVGFKLLGTDVCDTGFEVGESVANCKTVSVLVG